MKEPFKTGSTVLVQIHGFKVFSASPVPVPVRHPRTPSYLTMDIAPSYIFSTAEFADQLRLSPKLKYHGQFLKAHLPFNILIGKMENRPAHTPTWWSHTPQHGCRTHTNMVVAHTPTWSHTHQHGGRILLVVKQKI